MDIEIPVTAHYAQLLSLYKGNVRMWNEATLCSTRKKLQNTTKHSDIMVTSFSGLILGYDFKKSVSVSCMYYYCKFSIKCSVYNGYHIRHCK